MWSSQWRRTFWALTALSPPSLSQVTAAPSADQVLDQLTRLGELRANGILTDAEFDMQKARILSA
jgi:hypothetical protein